MLSYRIEGDNGPYLLLIHGWGVSFSIWQNLGRLLTPHYRLVMAELPGFGASPWIPLDAPYAELCAGAIQELRRSLKIERWSVLAYSSGTRAAESYMRIDSAHVSRAVFLCSAYLHLPNYLGLWLLDRLDRVLPSVTDWMLTGWRIAPMIALYGFNGRHRIHSREWTREINRQPTIALKEALREVFVMGRRSFDIGDTPTLFIWAKRDRAFTKPRDARGTHRSIDTMHSAPLLAAPLVAEAVLAHLDDHLQSCQPTPAAKVG